MLCFRSSRTIKSHTEPCVAEEPDVPRPHPDIFIGKGKNQAEDSESEKYSVSSVDPRAFYQAGIVRISRLLAGYNIFY